jgi:hypothetical protein
MPLPERDRKHEIALEAARIAYRVVFRQLADDGTAQGEALDSQIVQQEDLDRVTPYGFDSVPPDGTESVAVPGDAADTIVGERRSRPSSIPDPGNAGMLYGEGGAYMTPGDGGDGVLEPEAGQTINIGDSATKALALNGDSVNASTAFGIWVAAVSAALSLSSPGNPIGSVVASSTKGKGE